MQNMKDKYKSIIITAFVVFFVYVGIVLVNGKVFYTTNTKSADRGIYMWIPSFSITKGNMMAVALPRDYGKLKKGFILLKIVRGIPGDTFVVTDDYLKVDDTEYPLMKNPALPKLSKGTHKIPEGKYLMLNDVHDSFDGRYIGLIEQKNIQKRVVMFLNFEYLNKWYWDYKKFDSTIWIKEKLRELWKN